MLNRFTEMPFKNKAILFLAGTFALCLMSLSIFVFLLGRTDGSANQIPPQKFEYCGVDPQDLCVLSFGRDGAGNSIINFFVPSRNSPDFYLIVKKPQTENRYECKKSADIKTSVFCRGAALSLKQTIQVNIFASEDDQWIASGTFFLEAFLISAQSTLEVEGTQTLITQTAITATAEAAKTSYPNPTAYP